VKQTDHVEHGVYQSVGTATEQESHRQKSPRKGLEKAEHKQSEYRRKEKNTNEEKCEILKRKGK
jgi:hypothetical protein